MYTGDVLKRYDNFIFARYKIKQRLVTVVDQFLMCRLFRKTQGNLGVTNEYKLQKLDFFFNLFSNQRWSRYFHKIQTWIKIDY